MMADQHLTLEHFRRIKATLQERAIKPCVIATREEASAMNRVYAGIGVVANWKVGDEYYKVETLRLTTPIYADR